MVAKVLGMKEALIKYQAIIYRAVVYVVLLYWSEIWVVMDAMMTVIEEFHHIITI